MSTKVKFHDILVTAKSQNSKGFGLGLGLAHGLVNKVFLLLILLGWSLIDTIWFLLRRIVLYKIFEKLSELDKNREAVTRQMRFLSETNPENFLNKAIDCHLRVSSVSTKYKNKCKLCEVHDAIEVSIVTNYLNS